MRLQFLQPQVNTKDLVLYYKLWAGLTTAATVFDYSLSGNDGTVVSAPPPSYPGFDFTPSDYIDTGNTFQSTFRSSFTIAGWVKLDDGQGAVTVLAGNIEVGGTAHVKLDFNSDGSVQFGYRSDSSTGVWSTNDIIFVNGANPWTHIVGVADSTIAGVGGTVVYVNGVLKANDGVSTGDTTTVNFSLWTCNDNLYIGARNNNGTDQLHINGKIDDVMMFDKALSAVEIRNIYEITRFRYGV